MLEATRKRLESKARRSAERVGLRLKFSKSWGAIVYDSKTDAPIAGHSAKYEKGLTLDEVYEQIKQGGEVNE